MGCESGCGVVTPPRAPDGDPDDHNLGEPSGIAMTTRSNDPDSLDDDPVDLDSLDEDHD